MTLIFAKDKTLGAVKAALLAGRTVAWYQKQLIGPQGYLEALFEAAVKIEDIQYDGDVVRFRLNNHLDVDVELERTGQVGPKSLVVPARATALIKATVAGAGPQVELPYVVQNFLIGPSKGLPVTLTMPGQITINIGVEVGR